MDTAKEEAKQVWQDIRSGFGVAVEKTKEVHNQHVKPGMQKLREKVGEKYRGGGEGSGDAVVLPPQVVVAVAGTSQALDEVCTPLGGALAAAGHNLIFVESASALPGASQMFERRSMESVAEAYGAGRDNAPRMAHILQVQVEAGASDKRSTARHRYATLPITIPSVPACSEEQGGDWLVRCALCTARVVVVLIDGGEWPRP